MTLIFYLSSQPEPIPEIRAFVWDKALHLVEYGALAALLCRALRGENVGWTTAVVAALFVASIYGASDEWHQSFVATRQSDIRDWIADTIGAAAGTSVYVLDWARFLRKKRNGDQD